MHSPSKPSSSEFRNEAMASPTLWPEFNANFPFQLYDAFVRETDDHRFGNNSIMDLIDEGMKFQAKANAIFGRLRPKYKEAEEEAARKENAILKSALAKERSDRDIALFNNECLRKDLDQTKEELKTIKANHHEIVNMNVDLVQRNEIMMTKNEKLVATNQSLAKQVNKLETKEARHLKRRQKHEEELRELRALRDLGPPLTEELRKKIQEEYRKSNELNEEIVRMYSEGYEIYQSRGKAKLVAAKVDPALLDSSDGEGDA